MGKPFDRPIGNLPPGSFVALCMSGSYVVKLITSVWAVTFVLSVCLNSLANHGFNLLMLGIAFVTSLLIVPLMSPIVFFKSFVSLEGVKSYDGVGFYHSVPWSELTAFDTLNILGIVFYRVRGAKSPRILISVGVPRDHLHDAIATYMPAEHPLREHILSTVLPPGKPALSDPS